MAFREEIVRRGGRLYEVGGCVRDRLLGRPNKDVDYLVCGVPAGELQRLLSRHGRVHLVGKSFGVFKFTSQDGCVDVALPRREVSTGPGHRDFDVTTDHTLPVEVDLERRDFTINAIARDVATGRIIDPFHGREDLENRILRMVHPDAFVDDPLRMLRAIQFAARFELTLEAATGRRMEELAPSVTTVSAERIATELVKLLRAPVPSAGFRMMADRKLLVHVLPELDWLRGVQQPLRYHCFDAFDHSLAACDRVPWKGRLHLRLAALLHDLGKRDTFSVDGNGEIHFYGHAAVSADLAESILTRLRFTSVEDVQIAVDRIVHLVREHMFACRAEDRDRTLRRFIHRVGPEAVIDQIRLRIGDRLASVESDPAPWLALARRIRGLCADRRAAFCVRDLAVSGHDVMKAGVPRGPGVGRILSQLIEEVLDDPALNDREVLLARISALLDESADPGEPGCC